MQPRTASPGSSLLTLWGPLPGSLSPPGSRHGSSLESTISAGAPTVQTRAFCGRTGLGCPLGIISLCVPLPLAQSGAHHSSHERPVNRDGQGQGPGIRF